MKHFKMLLFLIILFSFFNIASAEEKPCAYLFYGVGCPHCAKVDPFIKSLEEQNKIKLERFEIYSNKENRKLLNKYFEIYNVPYTHRGIPVIFIGNEYLVGDEPILTKIEEKIEKYKGEKCPSLEDGNGGGEAGEKSPIEQLKALSWITVTGAAFVDSINPCAIAVLLILMGSLLTIGDKKKALKSGLAFTISVYIMYFLFGLGLFSAIQISGLSYYFYKLIGVMAILIGLANLKDYFWYNSLGFVMEIPKKWRPTLKTLLSRVTSPFGAFLMGFVVCFFELPCTGGPYIFILGLLAEKTTRLMAMPILLWYNLVFVVPLVIITLALYFGLMNVHSASEWKERNVKLLHLIAGVIMLGLGIIVVSGLI